MKTRAVAIIDYGLENLFSVTSACKRVGLPFVVTAKAKELQNASGIILPGVGAFGDAMEGLMKRDLIEPLNELLLSDKPFLGICLGMQLLLSESFEFGRHDGLNFVPGCVKRFPNAVFDGRTLKVPHVGWTRIHIAQKNTALESPGNLLRSVDHGAYMYFAHSFFVEPKDEGTVLTKSTYGPVEFCSSLLKRNVFACQYHPERSGPHGMKIYENFKNLITAKQ